MQKVKFIDLGLKDYKETWDLQQEIQNKLIQAKLAGVIPCPLPYLLFVEHPHVYTLGKSGKENNLLINHDFLSSIHATYYKIDRGGDITYHGPGQIVGYPLFDLDVLGMGVKQYIHQIEESIILTLKTYNLNASRIEGATGVWLTHPEQPALRKICAIGVKISRGVTMHGFALNVNTDLNYFSYINPCGFTDKGVTSIARETGSPANMNQVKQLLAEAIATQFGMDLVN